MGLALGWLLAKMAEQSISGTLIRMLIGRSWSSARSGLHSPVHRPPSHGLPGGGSEVHKDQGKCADSGHELSEEERS